MSPWQPDSQDSDALNASRVKRSADSRRRIESAILALTALAGVWWLRYSFESFFWCTAEVVTAVLLALFALLAREDRARFLGCCGLVATPLIFAFVARAMGSPIPYEMTGISMLGVGALALSLYSHSRRNLAMSIVASGFLILFAALISDSRSTLVPALVWIAICLWHLVANHWERVTACTPDVVRRDSSIRSATVIVGLLLFVVGGWAIHGRASKTRRFAWGIMPTSGGSMWSDDAARSGVGSGDAAIAAKDHPESFGAVESELFLESTESTLYDMFSDSIGQPKLKQKWERRQGMNSEKLIHAHQRTAKTERGGNTSFSTSREKPKPQPLRDAEEPAVLQWIGPTGIRLAMNRYDEFDGVDWSLQTSWKNDKLARVAYDDEAWYFDPRQTNQSVINQATLRHAGVLKVLRLDTTRIPTPMMTSGVHIKDIDRPDFFGIDHDGSFYMPGRYKIPPLTVLHVASTSVTEDELLKPAALANLESHLGMLARLRSEQGRSPKQSDGPLENELSTGQRLAGELAERLTANEANPYRKLQLIVAHLREHFAFDRNSTADEADPLADFLVRKRGGDHLFATAVAVMGRAIGLHTRLVSGFYVRPSAIDIGQGHASVVADDVHVWVEVQLDDGRWIELEPTPGYREPVYQPSNWLVAKRFAKQYWPHALCIFVLAMLVYRTRVIWFECFVWLVWSIGRSLPDRLRVRVLLAILQQRARFAGKPRRAGVPQRDWILSLTHNDETLASGALSCCDAADRMVFGGQAVSDWTTSANLLVRKMTTRYIAGRPSDDSTHLGTSA